MGSIPTNGDNYLTVEVLNPPFCLSILNLPKVSLGRSQIGVPQNDLADDLDWYS
jgi:hypothetical protein